MRWLLTLAAANGFLAVALGAFGAHGLRARLLNLEDGAKRLEWWHTASSYHLAHALALGLAALVAARAQGGPAVYGGYAFTLGIALFCGSLYVMAVSGFRGLGAVTPVGGLLFLAGWACLFAASLRP